MNAFPNFRKMLAYIYGLLLLCSCSPNDPVVFVEDLKQKRRISVQIIAHENFLWEEGQSNSTCSATGAFSAIDNSMTVNIRTNSTQSDAEFSCKLVFKGINPNNIHGQAPLEGSFVYTKNIKGTTLINYFPLYENPPSGCIIVDTLVRQTQLGVISFIRTANPSEFLFSGNFIGFGYKNVLSECEEPLPRPFSIGVKNMILTAR